MSLFSVKGTSLSKKCHLDSVCTFLTGRRGTQTLALNEDKKANRLSGWGAVQFIDIGIITGFSFV